MFQRAKKWFNQGREKSKQETKQKRAKRNLIKRKSDSKNKVSKEDFFLIKDGKVQYLENTKIPLPRKKKESETQEEYNKFLNAYRTICKDLIDEYRNKKKKANSLYQLKKEEIIQDLPIKSKKESRYQGIMSLDEIRAARENCNILITSTEENTYNNSSIYHLKKEQIIQDLPINSQEESRYQGIMSEDEIKISQQKVKVLTKSK